VWPRRHVGNSSCCSAGTTRQTDVQKDGLVTAVLAPDRCYVGVPQPGMDRRFGPPTHFTVFPMSGLVLPMSLPTRPAMFDLDLIPRTRCLTISYSVALRISKIGSADELRCARGPVAEAVNELENQSV